MLTQSQEHTAHTETIERLWGSAKWRNKKQRGTARHDLDSYFTEFVWRQNIGDDTPFDQILMDLKTYFPPQKNLLITYIIFLPDFFKYYTLFCNHFL